MEKITIGNNDNLVFNGILAQDEGPENDPIDRPSHYANSEIQPKDFMKENFSAEMLIGAYIWNVIKYCARFRKKGDPLNDLKKAQKYLTWAIELYEGK